METCTNVSYVVTTPVVFGTSTGCHVDFNASLTVTGKGVGVSATEQTEIVAGACAGFTVSGATAKVSDNYLGTFDVPVKVAMTSSGWTFQGNYVFISAPTARVVVMNVVGSISPGCTRARNGSVSFVGTFTGNYQIV